MNHRLFIKTYFPFVLSYLNKNPKYKRYIIHAEHKLSLFKRKLNSKLIKSGKIKSSHEINDLFIKVKENNLFDLEFYEGSQNRKFNTELDAFSDFYYKSFFSDVNPCRDFSVKKYYINNFDVYCDYTNALEHYVKYGKYEGRQTFPVSATTVRSVIEESSSSFSVNKKIALVFHIFYDDFIPYYLNCIKELDFDVDVFITLNKSYSIDSVKKQFESLNNINKVEVKSAPNKGRNFGPFLVEYSNDLLEYDYFCHLHTKKSLYSGREQKQWANYLGEYLLKDTLVVKRALNIFEANNKLGIYYPKSFFMMPCWANHWLKNLNEGKQLAEFYGVNINSKGFLNYPVGGMFWVRPQAIRNILEKKYTYDDFPDEPLPADGSSLHALERIFGDVAKSNGYEQFVYIPDSGVFTLDDGYIFDGYKNIDIEKVYADLNNFEIISFDIFDTLLRREYTYNDYAKYQLGKELVELGIVNKAEDFVSIRNNCELTLRKRKLFIGDVNIFEIYGEIISELNLGKDKIAIFANKEFEYDYKLMQPKDEMISLLYKLIGSGKTIYLTSDIYYTEEQVMKILKKVSVYKGFNLFLSSMLNVRKDNGTMWSYLIKEHKINKYRFIHVGDNIVADCQIPGDFGLQSYSILNPMDKLKYLNINDPFEKFTNDNIDEKLILKYGKIISNLGRFPFL
ncbi:TPA: rhamnan synthesis F family protein [Photobacterium damselae]|uniref:rhamnan synthesis F family protein n=1 Tax=Photobacterium damselae TaxID=38293 RepID=UPI0012447CED|nr:rhamnan synthesis F family protein [Photobacterium damselae]KAB1182868.1 glycosyl transferase family 1 [Photobacterium damselae subsp. damselae]MBF7101634.1 glycosyl transferase family 1 [Photobacterium damselae]